MANSEYTNSDLDQAIASHVRSDWPFVIYRLLILAVVFGFIARAILRFDLPAGLVVVPIVLEYLFVVWIGYALSRYVIDCPAFRAQAGSIKIALVLTGVVVFVVLFALAAKDGSFSLTRIPDEWTHAWRLSVESGLIWSIAVGTAGLVFATLPDIHRWRRHGGKFIWGANMHNSMRFGVIVIFIFPIMFLGAWVDESLGGWNESQRLQWIVLGCLLALELLTLGIGVSMHRKVSPSRE